MSKTLPSGSVKVVHLVPYSSNSAILVAPRATARSTSAGRSSRQGAVVDRAVEQGRPEGGYLVSALGIDDNLAKSESHVVFLSRLET